MERNPYYVRTLMDVMKHWEEDSVDIDLTHPQIDASKLNRLTQKYATIKSNNSMMVKKLKREMKSERLFRTRWYLHKVKDPDELAEHGVKQHQETIMKTDIGLYLDADEKILEMQEQIDHHEEIVDFCIIVLKAISDRNWAIRNIIEWEKRINAG